MGSNGLRPACTGARRPGCSALLAVAAGCGCVCSREWDYGALTENGRPTIVVDGTIAVDQVAANRMGGICLVGSGSNTIECGPSWMEASLPIEGEIRQLVAGYLWVAARLDNSVMGWAVGADGYEGGTLGVGAFDDFWSDVGGYCTVSDGLGRCQDFEGQSECTLPADDVAGFTAVDDNGSRQVVVCGLSASNLECVRLRTCEPVELFDREEFVAIDGGDTGFCGITTDGEIKCRGIASPCHSSRTWTSVSVSWHGCALDTEGNAACWSPTTGALGAGPSGLTSVSAGSGTGCGIGQDGFAHCWGGLDIEPGPDSQ